MIEPVYPFQRCVLDDLEAAPWAAAKLLSPARRRRCIDHIRGMMAVSARRVCRVLGQHRSTQRKVPRGADDEAELTEDIIALARQYGRYGYRRVTPSICLPEFHPIIEFSNFLATLSRFNIL